MEVGRAGIGSSECDKQRSDDEQRRARTSADCKEGGEEREWRECGGGGGEDGGSGENAVKRRREERTLRRIVRRDGAVRMERHAMLVLCLTKCCVESIPREPWPSRARCAATRWKRTTFRHTQSVFFPSMTFDNLHRLHCRVNLNHLDDQPDAVVLIVSACFSFEQSTAWPVHRWIRAGAMLCLATHHAVFHHPLSKPTAAHKQFAYLLRDACA